MKGIISTMTLISLSLLSFGLSMDAFAVSVCKGLSIQKLQHRHAIIVGLYFGGFQAGMPLLGYYLGLQFQDAIVSIDHWIAFVLLSFIGFNMIKESINKEEESCNASLKFYDMFTLAVATSIDALAVGITFAFLQINIIPAVCFIGAFTFILSVIGVKVGSAFGSRYKSKAELIGGLILIFMGTKILIEHLFLS